MGHLPGKYGQYGDDEDNKDKINEQEIYKKEKLEPLLQEACIIILRN
ncbi:MAG: hypothetical protein KME64_01500 [Scytonematopsis contorta HA4267-MV1]|nr:hypothetical protein [Scytonematopsis contorta HA4267-MV1]